MNKVFLIGRLTKDPDLRYTQQGQATSVPVIVTFITSTIAIWIIH